MKNIAIYIHNTANEEIIRKIKNYYLDKDRSVDFFIASANMIENISIQDTAIINSIHTNWMKGIVVFTKIVDFLNHKNQILAKPVLVIEKKEIAELTPKIIEECEILIVDTLKVRKIKNAELQHIK